MRQQVACGDCLIPCLRNSTCLGYKMSVHGREFAKGDQSTQSRRKFWKSGYKSCPNCNKDLIKAAAFSAGCRHNGDGYGTTVFSCEKDGCNWQTSFLYDEGGDGPYYHETRSWAAEEERRRQGMSDTENIRKIEYKTLTAEKKKSFILMLKQAGEEVVQRMMDLQGYSPADIRNLLADEAIKQTLRSQGHSEAQIKELISSPESNDLEDSTKACSIS